MQNLPHHFRNGETLAQIGVRVGCGRNDREHHAAGGPLMRRGKATREVVTCINPDGLGRGLNESMPRNSGLLLHDRDLKFRGSSIIHSQ